MKKKEGRRRQKAAPKWEIEIDVRALLMLVVTVVLCLLFLLSCFMYARSFLGLRHFEIVGVSRYDDREIVTAAKLNLGDKLYGLDLDQIEENILAGCPYLESVKVKPKFPNTLRIEVESRKPEWYIDLAGDYYILDSNLVMIHESAREDALLAEGVTKLKLPMLKSVMLGELPTFGIRDDGTRDEDTIRKTVEILGLIRSTRFKSRITEVDLTDRFAISMTVDGGYYVYLGSYLGNTGALEAKLKEVETVLNSEKAKQYPKAEIDASGAEVYFKPIS